MKGWLFFFLFPLLLMGAEEKRGVFVPHCEQGDSYISGDGFKEICDFAYDKTNSFDPLLVREGELVFVDRDMLRSFFSKVHPRISHRYILVTHNGGYRKGGSIPGPYYLFLNDEKIIAWFGSNPTLKHPKLVGLPLGLESSLWKDGNINFYYDAIAKAPQVRKHLLYVNFSLKNDPLLRLPVFFSFADKPFCCVANENGFINYLQGISESKFILCPPSKSGDSFRVWEALILGSIPIVQSSVLDELYAQLPVVIIQEWSEITEEFLENKYQEMGKKQFSYQKLFASYWKKRIQEFSHRKAVAKGASL